MRFSITGALAVAVMLGLSVGCSGDMKQTAGCRSSADCDGLLCSGPNVPSYGCPFPPDSFYCWNNESCLYEGDTCHVIVDHCELDGWGTQCGWACAVDSECQTGFVCNDDKACVPQRCDQGFACPAYQACDPSSIDRTKEGVLGLTHGCVFVPCAVDGDCAQGLFCVNDVCQESLGICILPGPETPNA